MSSSVRPVGDAAGRFGAMPIRPILRPPRVSSPIVTGTSRTAPSRRTSSVDRATRVRLDAVDQLPESRAIGWPSNRDDLIADLQAGALAGAAFADDAR